MKKNIKHCILLLFTGILLLNTPLSIAMNLQEQKYKKIDELRQAYFYIQQSYQKNKDKELRSDNIKNLMTYLVNENEKNNYGMTYHDVMPKISYDVAQAHINHIYLKEISKNNSEHAMPITHCVKTLHDYYQFLFNQNNLCDPKIITMIAIQQDDTDFEFKWPFSENSSEKNAFLTLLKEKKTKANRLQSMFDYFCGFLFFLSMIPSIRQFFLHVSISETEEKCPVTIFPLLMGDTGNDPFSGDMIICLLPAFFFLLVIASPSIIHWAKCIDEKTKKINTILTTKEQTKSHDIISFKTYFDQLYFKAKKFIENNKNQEFLKNFEKDQKAFLQKLLEQEEDFLFNESEEKEKYDFYWWPVPRC